MSGVGTIAAARIIPRDAPPFIAVSMRAMDQAAHLCLRHAGLPGRLGATRLGPHFRPTEVLAACCTSRGLSKSCLTTILAAEAGEERADRPAGSIEAHGVHQHWCRGDSDRPRPLGGGPARGRPLRSTTARRRATASRCDRDLAEGGRDALAADQAAASVGRRGRAGDRPGAARGGAAAPPRASGPRRAPHRASASPRDTFAATTRSTQPRRERITEPPPLAYGSRTTPDGSAHRIIAHRGLHGRRGAPTRPRTASSERADLNAIFGTSPPLKSWGVFTHRILAAGDLNMATE